MSINYERMMNESMMRFVADVLLAVKNDDLEGQQQVYITFITNAKGVILPDRLRAEYPEEMTIVFQHEFYNLVVGWKSFSVELSFNGCIEAITVPFSSITTFVDPSEEFGLRFDPWKYDDHPVSDDLSSKKLNTSISKTVCADGTVEECHEGIDDDNERVVDFSQFLKR